MGAAVGRREGSGVRERGAHALSLRLGGLETLRRRRQNTAGTMENKPTQGKTGLSHRRPRDDRRRCGAARPGATKPRVLIFGRRWIPIDFEIIFDSGLCSRDGGSLPPEALSKPLRRTPTSCVNVGLMKSNLLESYLCQFWIWDNGRCTFGKQSIAGRV